MPPTRTVLLASPRSFCAGVERAIAAVEHLLDERDGPVYVRKQIVHNTHVVADLTARGAVFVDELADVPRGATVVFSAHGVAPPVWHDAARRQLDVVDATCPLVAKVHAEARRFAQRGDTNRQRPGLVDDVVESLRTLGPVEVQEREVTRETVRFLPPPAARPAHEPEPGEAGVPGPGGVVSFVTFASTVHLLGGGIPFIDLGMWTDLI